jgi:hypothetical protein
MLSQEGWLATALRLNALQLAGINRLLPEHFPIGDCRWRMLDVTSVKGIKSKIGIVICVTDDL